MKGKNWRDFEPEKKKRTTEVHHRKKRKRKGGFLRKLRLAVILFAIGYFGFLAIYKPYTIALDAGHGGVDIGAEGVIHEVELTERTVEELEMLLKEDGRFRVILSRDAGEGVSIDERNAKFQKKNPDLMLSVHGNASDDESARGFECYPTPPGYENHDSSLVFAEVIAEEMETVGARLRGSGTEGVRFGYYNANGVKVLVDSSDTKVYDMDTFGMLKNMDCPAVLAEQCFITNEQDVAEFGTEEGCKKAAAAYYRAICRYLESVEETDE